MDQKKYFLTTSLKEEPGLKLKTEREHDRRQFLGIAVHQTLGLVGRGRRLRAAVHQTPGLVARVAA